ncbi:MAG: arsenic efflux protein [Clostridia bacterium]|nr:arsenic efflux protein [Clostridia bacterium]
MDWFIDALIDSLKLLPFLFIAYIVIELAEVLMSKKAKSGQTYKGKWGAVIGASFGMIPQCGFSVVASDLFSKRKITIGTLIAIFIATSDEALPILFSEIGKPYVWLTILELVGTKFVVGLIFGLLIDLIFRKQNAQKIACQVAEDHSEEDHDHKEDHIKGCCGHNLEEDKIHPAKQYLLHPLIHTLKIFAYIFVVNVIFSALIYYVGEEPITNFLLSAKYFAPLFAILIGLIPNCASSVILTNLLLIGGLTFSAAIAGLIVNAGIAYLVLFKQNKNVKENLTIVGLVSLIALLTGYVLLICGL